CLRLFTVEPERPDFSSPRLYSCIAFSTFFEARLPYFFPPEREVELERDRDDPRLDDFFMGIVVLLSRRTCRDERSGASTAPRSVGVALTSGVCRLDKPQSLREEGRKPRAT